MVTTTATTTTTTTTTIIDITNYNHENQFSKLISKNHKNVSLDELQCEHLSQK